MTTEPSSAPQNTVSALRRAMRDYTESPELLDALEQFRDMRTHCKKPLTVRALQLICRELDKLSGGNEAIKIAILEQSIINSWRGVFPLATGRRVSGQHGNKRADGKARDYGQSDFGALKD